MIAARNAAEWLEATMRSLLAQTIPAGDVELIVVDDGSTDGTPELVERLVADSGITYRIHRNDRSAGPSAARNYGWRDTRAPWIQFLDADDLLAPAKIAHQFALANTADDRVAVVYSPWARLLQSSGRWIRAETTTRPIIGSEPLRDILAPDNFIATGSQMFRRTWLERVEGYTETCQILEDVDLLMRIALAGGTFLEARSDEALFWYRRHPTSSSRKSRLAFARGIVRNAGVAEEHWRDVQTLSPGRSRFLADILFDAARVMAHEGDSEFLTVASRIERLAPGFHPKTPALLGALSRVIGYRRAELLSVRYRALKDVIRLRS